MWADLISLNKEILKHRITEAVFNFISCYHIIFLMLAYFVDSLDINEYLFCCVHWSIICVSDTMSNTVHVFNSFSSKKNKFSFPSLKLDFMWLFFIRLMNFFYSQISKKFYHKWIYDFLCIDKI